MLEFRASCYLETYTPGPRKFPDCNNPTLSISTLQIQNIVTLLPTKNYASKTTTNGKIFLCFHPLDDEAFPPHEYQSIFCVYLPESLSFLMSTLTLYVKAVINTRCMVAGGDGCKAGRTVGKKS